MAIFQDHLPGFSPLTPATREWIAGVKDISMLHTQTLEALYQLARNGQGTILEIGPYIGGSTTVMARALKDAAGFFGRSRRFVTLESGGSYTSHPQLPSKDILADLDANLRKAGVRKRVEIVSGWSTDYHVIRKVRNMLGERQVSLLVIDASGLVRNEFLHWGPCCDVPCYVVIDDYVEIGSADLKSPSIRPVIDHLTREGQLEELALLPWGTWFGKIVKPIHLPPTMTATGPGAWRLHAPFTPLGKTGWVTSLALDAMPEIIERTTGPKPARLMVFEDDRPLGPPDSPLKQIKEQGRGAFDQRGGKHFTRLMYTASDNSDPNSNGRAYDVRLVW
jgi:predicted O-methyltransferase YrrM